MSIGHEHEQESRLAHGRGADTLLKSGGAPSLLRRFNSFRDDYDIPYGVGVSVDGTTRYGDRDLVRALYDPAYAEHLIGERIDSGLSPNDTLECCLRNVTVEKVLVDSDNPINDYTGAHDFGAAAEFDLVRQKGSTPVRFRRGLAKILHFCSRKPLKSIPQDYDCAAALADHTSNGRRILAELKRLGVEDADHVEKASVNYGKAHGEDRCEACSQWQGQGNAPLGQCSIVQGLVRGDRTCDRFQPQGAKSDEVGSLSSDSAGKVQKPTVKPADGAAKVPPHDKGQKLSSAGTQHILLARHGATALNNADNSVDRIRGQKDIPLSAQGKAEAERLAKKIAEDPPDVIVTSDLKRAHDTAKAIAKACSLPVSEVSKGLRPWRLGYLTGMLTKDAIPIMAQYIERQPDAPVPAGKGEPEGESFNSFVHRYLDTVTDLLRKYPGKVILFVAHHRNERVMFAWEAKGFPADGSVDVKVFSKKGELPGTVCPMEIPLAAIEQYERSHRGSTRPSIRGK